MSTVTTMTLTRALSKLKVIDKRLGEVKAGKFFAHKVGQRLNGTTLDESGFSREQQSMWDELSSLVDARVAIKTAISKANAATNVEVCGEVMSIDAAVARKLFYPSYIQTLNSIVNEHNILLTSIEKHNRGVTDRLDKMLESLVGKDKKMADGEIEAVSKPFLSQNEASMVDSNQVYRKAVDEIQRIKNFMGEVDFVLSEINARTEITVDLKVAV